MSDEPNFPDQVRDALSHLYDAAHLECHPLVTLLLPPSTSSRLTRAQMLRSTLKEAIETLRPHQGNPSTEPEWRSYLALYHRYVKGESLLEVQQDLGLSRRQVYRELRQGLEAVTAVLQRYRPTCDVTTIDPISENDSEVELVLRELDQWKMDRQICSVQTMLDDTLWLLKPLMEPRGTEIHIEIPAPPPAVFADPTLIRQALFRLLRLMIRYTDQGIITVTAETRSSLASIQISGDGDPLDVHSEDWEVASLLIERQGGQTTRERCENRQTVVTLTLSLSSQARVLVIDDVTATQDLFRRYLEPCNYQIFGADDSAQASQMAVRIAPDVIILDVMMPGMDGWQILRDLQRNPETSSIPVVVCSVLDEPELALSLGATAFIKKPVERLKLIQTVERVRAAALAA